MKKVLCAFLAAVSACVFCGCGNGSGSVPIGEQSSAEYGDVPQGGVQSEESSTESSREESVGIKPEIEMDGQKIALPCKVEDINGITIDREYSFVVVPAEGNVDEYSTAYFYYNDKRAGLIRLDGDCSEKADLGKETVVGIDIFDDVPVSCFGLTFESTGEDIIDLLGEPDKGGSTIMSYYIDGNSADHIDFDLNSSGKIKAVRIYLGLG